MLLILPGTPAMTSRGCLESDFETMAEFLLRAAQIASTVQREHGKKGFLKVFQGNKDIVDLRTRVESFATQFAMPGFDVWMGSRVAAYKGLLVTIRHLKGNWKDYHHPPLIPDRSLLLMLPSKFMSSVCPCVLGWCLCDYFGYGWCSHQPFTT